MHISKKQLGNLKLKSQTAMEDDARSRYQDIKRLMKRILIKNSKAAQPDRVPSGVSIQRLIRN